MKMIKTWLKELEEPYKTQVLDNCEPDMLKFKDKSLSEALKGAFVWSVSPQEHYYWEELYNKLKNENR